MDNCNIFPWVLKEKKENQYFHVQCMSYFNEDYFSLLLYSGCAFLFFIIVLSDNDED